MRAKQQHLPFRQNGGARSGAGRKPKEGKAGVSHLKRPEIRRRMPVHITLRVRREVWNLRSRRCYRALKEAFRGGNDRFGFRLNHFSVMGNHIHLIGEADGNHALSRGAQGIEIRAAKRLNRVMGRRGSVFADRFHAHILKTPSEVRRALDYVLQNARKHYGIKGVDQYSSACAHELVVAAQTWLLRKVLDRPG